MYLNDSPIIDKKDDLLGRSTFVSNLARSIVDNKATDTFCIGIYGKWGSGKTSIINMLKQEIGSIYEVDPNNEKPAKRMLLELRRLDSGNIKTNLTIEKERNEYTPEYTKLVRDFYLKL